jgi:hypothetical protein
VPYHIELHEQNVVPFLEDTGRVSPAVRQAIERHLAEDLGQHGDHYCLSEEYRVAGTAYLRYDLLLLDPDTDRLRSFRFYVSDGAAQFGVLKVLLVEETTPAAGTD